MKVKTLFIKRYLNYEFIIYERDVNKDTKYYYLNFTINSKDKVEYHGMFTKQDRKSIDHFINNYANRVIDDKEINKDTQTIYLYLQ